MARVLIRPAIAFWLPILAFGQEPSSPSPTPLPASVSAPAPANVSSATTPSEGSGDKVVLKDGQAIVMRSMRRLSSETARAGETVQFEVVKPVAVGDLVIIPEHAVATGKLVVADKKKRRLRAGKLTVAVEHISVVTGETASLRPTEVRGTDIIDYGQHVDPGPGAILIAPLIILLSHGPERVIPAATRVVAYLDGDLVLDREAVEQAQTALPKPRTDVGTIYIYRPPVKRDYPNNFTGISCGAALLGWFHPGQFIGLQLPPGRYWLRAPVIVQLGHTVDKKYLGGKLKQYFSLDVEPGRSYYLRPATRKINWEKTEGYLEEVDEATGKDAIFAAQSWADFGLEEITPEMLSHLRAQPKAASDTGDRSSRD